LVESKNVIAAYGKQNSLDKKLFRNFNSSSSGLNGIKFHIPNSCIKDYPANEISIYTAEGIYCGLNTVSENETTLCVLERRANDDVSPRERIIKLLESNKSFSDLFKKDFSNLLNDLPIYGTGNIYFGKRNVVENHVFMIGDAAGFIAPLAGDGIGMAFQSAKLISSLLAEYKRGKYKREELERKYISDWNRMFRKRTRIALFIQNLVLNNVTNNLTYTLFHGFPSLIPNLIKATRGK
jgi:flavin-dependent dehydrogenase